MCDFIAQLVEHRSGIAEVVGSNPVEALIFFRLVFRTAQVERFTAMIIIPFHDRTVEQVPGTSFSARSISPSSPTRLFFSSQQIFTKSFPALNFNAESR